MISITPTDVQKKKARVSSDRWNEIADYHCSFLMMRKEKLFI